MRFRLGLILGFVAGYVSGSKAGRERYQQIQQLWGSFARSEPAQQLGAEVRDVAHRAGDALEQKATEGVDKVTGLMGGGRSGGGTGTDTGTGTGTGTGTEDVDLGRIPPA